MPKSLTFYGISSDTQAKIYDRKNHRCMGQAPRQPERPKGSKDEMAPARCQARKAPRLLVSKLNDFLLLLLKTQTNIKEPYSPKAQFMFAQHLILKRNFKRHLFEIIPRQTVLLCARKGSNKYKVYRCLARYSPRATTTN